MLRIKREEPITPSKLNPQVNADLESVVLCALEKDRHRRYASAEEFATDLQHVLLNTPVKARRLSSSIRATRGRCTSSCVPGTRSICRSPRPA